MSAIRQGRPMILVYDPVCSGVEAQYQYIAKCRCQDVEHDADATPIDTLLAGA